MADFWSMTPRETLEVIEATQWQHEQLWQREATIAWLTARLMRTKKMPTLKNLLTTTKGPKKITKKELDQSRDDFKQAADTLDLSKIKAKNG